MMKMDKVFVQGKLVCIDGMRPDGRSWIAGETLEQIQARYPGAEVANFDEWIIEKEKALCTEPEEITEERFIEMLEVLPPQRWQHGRDCESFELMEHLSGRVTSIYCRFGSKYYAFNAVAGQSLAAHATHCGQTAVTPATA